MTVQDVLIDEAQADSKDGAAGRDDSIDDAELLFEIVTQYGEGRSVDQGGASTEHNPVGEVQNLNTLVEPGRETHAHCGQHRAEDGGQSETNFVTQDAD